MIVAGARGHAKEILQVIIEKNEHNDELIFFDDISLDSSELLYKQFKIIRNVKQAEDYFKYKDARFALGLGNPKSRLDLTSKLEKHGGKLNSIISNSALIGKFNVQLGQGLNIMNFVMISNDVQIGMGTLINAYACVHHDVTIGKFCEISPHAVLLGGCYIGDFTAIGSNATILPNVKVGVNVIIGAGSVVLHDLPNNCTAVGNPAKIIKKN
jgi:sugar O-acyltransferase (sialic acid O-acetyltransferase NeuD family)